METYSIKKKLLIIKFVSKCVNKETYSCHVYL